MRSHFRAAGMHVTLSLCCLGAPGLPQPQPQPQEGNADAVYTNGKIYTVEESRPWAEAVAVTADRFVFVGSSHDAQSYVGPQTRVVDLEGRFVAPGFHDLHVHPDLLFEPKYTNQLQTAPLGPEDLKEAVLEYAKENPGDGWIFGGTWAPDLFAAAGVEGNADYLDGFVADRPVGLISTSRHSLMVNSKGMELAGIDRDTYEPDHGIITRAEDGTPTGDFANGAQSLFAHVLPQANWQQLREAYREGMSLLNSRGFVAARAQHTNTVRLRAVQALEREGALTIRYDMATSWKDDPIFPCRTGPS